MEINAFQRKSDVIIQKSIREGFGLIISESLWKGTAVVANRAGASRCRWKTASAAFWSIARSSAQRRPSTSCATRGGEENGQVWARARPRALPDPSPLRTGCGSSPSSSIDCDFCLQPKGLRPTAMNALPSWRAAATPRHNACVRAVVRAGSHRAWTLGVRDGYVGLLNRQLIILHRHDVSNIIQRGGVFLGSLRCEEFYTPEGRARGAEVLRAFNVDGLVAIGGDGTLRGARALSRRARHRRILVPATIDNDAPGTDWTIGFDTAVNAAVEAIDRLRDTAEATERVFFVEVMGRESGALALHAGLSAGADAILVPESRDEHRGACRPAESGDTATLPQPYRCRRRRAGGRRRLRHRRAECGPHQLDYRVTVLGRVQRGGTPSARDRLLASQLGICGRAGAYGREDGPRRRGAKWRNPTDTLRGAEGGEEAGAPGAPRAHAGPLLADGSVDKLARAGQGQHIVGAVLDQRGAGVAEQLLDQAALR